MSKKLQLFCIAILSSILLKGQSLDMVGDQKDPHKSTQSATGAPSQQWDDWFNKEVEKFEKGLLAGKTASLSYQIPVVFHVIHYGQGVGTFPNIDSAQINSQVRVLNADFAGIGFNYTNVPQPFAGLEVNTGITFCLAKRDPTGAILTEPGIHRVNANTQGWADPTTTVNIVSYINNTVKPTAGCLWDPTKYLNIWLSDKTPTITNISYATYPAGTALTGIPNSGGTASDDGIWCWTKAVGNVGSLAAPHNKGRTITKEAGHWLGLRNIWGDGNCLDDYCSDTPWAKQANSGCPVWPSYVNRCGINQSPDGEMTMNFMDETDDACRYMFTPRQKTRMLTAMSQCIYRNLLGTHNLCSTVTTGAAPAVASFSFNEIPCIGQAVTPVNSSSGYPWPLYQWSSAPSTVIYPAPSVAQPAITFNSPGTYTLYLTATNTANIASFSLVVNNVTTCPTSPLCLDSIRMIKNVDTLAAYKLTNNPSVSACQTGFPGYLTGTNCYNDKEFAQFFPASTYSTIPLPQINSVIVIFDSAGTRATPATLATQIKCIIYGGTAGAGPNTQITFKSDSLGKIAASTRTNIVQYIGTPTYTLTTGTKAIPFKFDFASPVVLTPNIAGFFASITTPYQSLSDSIRIFSNTITNLSNDSSSWVLLNSSNNWRTLRYGRSSKVQLAIIPQMTCRPVVGIKELQSEFISNITVVPNPSNGQFNLIFTLPKEQSIEIKTYNAMGQQIGSDKLKDVGRTILNMDLSNKPDGIYFIDISNGAERTVQKIIVNH